MLITKEIQIDMGHRVPNHKSKCRNLHGHRYTIEIGVDDKVITEEKSSSEGMVIDFGDLKQIMMDEIDAKLDHGFMMFEGDNLWNVFKTIRDGFQMKIISVSFIPTAENIAKWLYIKMKMKLQEVGIKIKHVKVWETPTSTATYEETN